MLTKEKRIQFVELHNQGLRGHAIAQVLSLEAGHCKDWCLTIEVFGPDTFINMASKKVTYSYETKLAAVQDRESGLSLREIMAKHSILSVTTLSGWIRRYAKDGAEGLKPKPLGRPKKTSSSEMSREEQLLQRIKYLETENAVLKKVRTLMASKH